MAVRQDAYDRLVAELDLELLHLAQMQSLLAEEQRELVSGRTDRLEAIAAEKVVQLRALELYGKRCEGLLAELGFATTREGMEACAAALGGAKGRALRAAWSRLAVAASEARDFNEQNGALINMQLAHVGGRLAHLDGSPDGGTLYSAAGHLQTGPSARLLGRS